MRNLKKIFAVLVVVALMASMMVPALAAGFTYEAEATKLNNIKLMEGMNLGDKVTRIQALTFAIKAAGKNAEAQALTDAEVAEILANVVDADKVPTWGKKYLAWAVKNGKTAGVDASIAPKVKFVADGTVDAKVFLYWILSIGMGYQGLGTATATSKAVDAKVITVTQAVDFNLKGELIRDDVAGMLFGAAMTGVNADGKGFMASLISAGFVTQQLASDNGFAAAPAPVALDATITSLNTMQFQVVFNKEVNKDDAQKASFYQVKKDSTTYTISDAAIAADNKTVTITLAPGNAIANNTTVKVTVKKDLKDSTGTKLAADVAKDVAVGDTTFPTFDSVEAKGEKTLRLFFNEPVQVNGGADFTIKSGSYTWTVVTATANIKDHYVDLALGTALIEGTVNITVKNTVKDYANLPVFEKTIGYAYAKTTVAPTATITKSEPGKVVVKFDRPVYGQVKVSHSIKDYAAYSVTQAVVDAAGAKDEWTFDFSSKKLPAGNVNVFVTMGDKDNAAIKDLFGNKYVEQSFTVSVVTDTAAPAISETKLNDKTNFQITFDEAVDASEVKIANFALAKADGTSVLFSVAASNENKTITFTPAGGFADNTTYNLTIKKVKDTSGNANSADIVQSFTTGDNTAPSIKKDTFAVDNDGKIYIYFSEAMNETAMLTKANYMVSTGAGVSYKALGDKDTLTKINEKVVLIDLDGTAVTLPNVSISTSVTDLAGKKLTEAALSINTASVAELAAGIPAETLKIDKAEAIAKDKIKVTFTRELSQFDSADLSVVRAGSTTTVAIAAVESVSGKEVVIKLGSDLSTDAKYAGSTDAISVSAIEHPANTKSTYGSVVSTSSAIAADKIVAEVLKSNDTYNVISTIPTVGAVDSVAVSENTTGTIQIKFSEVMDDASISNLSFSVNGYSIYQVDATTVDSGATIVLYVKCNADNTTYLPTVTQSYDIKDDNGNVLKAGTSWSSKR